MARTKQENLIEDFMFRFPWMYKRMEKWVNYGNNQLLIYMNDGRTILYDDFNHVPYNIKLFDHPKELTETEWCKGFSMQLSKALIRNCMSQYELAKRIGVTEATMSRYMNSKRIPKGQTLSVMAEELNCSIDDLMPREYIILD